MSRAFRSIAAVVSVFGCILWAGPALHAGEAVGRVTLDVYTRSDSDRCQALCDYLEKLAGERKGLDIVIHDTLTDVEARREAQQLCTKFRIEKPALPIVHVMDTLRVGFTDSEEGRRRIESLLSIEVFTRNGCHRCRDAKIFLEDLGQRWPALHFDIKEITTDRDALNRLTSLASQYGKRASSVPAFHLCGQLKIGYLGPRTSGRELESIIRKAARSQKPEAAKKKLNGE